MLQEIRCNEEIERTKETAKEGQTDTGLVQEGLLTQKRKSFDYTKLYQRLVRKKEDKHVDKAEKRADTFMHLYKDKLLLKVSYSFNLKPQSFGYPNLTKKVHSIKEDTKNETKPITTEEIGLC